ncbi:MAG TPA: RING finger protein [Planctomycetota bacterium]|nr:RING finger protein [Planctomycetota bacterium]
MQAQIAWIHSTIDGGACLICGSPLERRIVRCARCRTPHHLDCWKYNGRCSIFGCDEHQFTHPL